MRLSRALTPCAFVAHPAIALTAVFNGIVGRENTGGRNSMANPYAFAADAVATIHTLFVAFIVGGQAAILIGWIKHWNWTRHPVFRVAHLAAVGLVVLESWFDIPCSLTLLENRLRVLAGADRYEISFIGYWLDHLLFYTAPAWVFTLIYSLFGTLAVVTLLAYPPRRLRPRKTSR